MTSEPWRFLDVSSIKDLASLRLLSRIIDSHRLVLEAQVNQAQQVQNAVAERMKSLESQPR